MKNKKQKSKVENKIFSNIKLKNEIKKINTIKI